MYMSVCSITFENFSTHLMMVLENAKKKEVSSTIHQAAAAATYQIATFDVISHLHSRPSTESASSTVEIRGTGSIWLHLTLNFLCYI